MRCLLRAVSEKRDCTITLRRGSSGVRLNQTALPATSGVGENNLSSILRGALPS
jgi:hypothetical protein